MALNQKQISSFIDNILSLFETLKHDIQRDRVVSDKTLLVLNTAIIAYNEIAQESKALRDPKTKLQ